MTCSPNYLILGNIQLFITSIWYSNAKSLDFSIVFGVVKSNTWWQIVSSNILRSYIHVVVHRYKLVVLLCPKSLDMNPMWICAFHLLIFYGFSSKLLEPQFKLDDLRNHFCNSDVFTSKFTGFFLQFYLLLSKVHFSDLFEGQHYLKKIYIN